MKEKTQSGEPTLLERVVAQGCRRLAVISLHPEAGARTVLESITTEFHRRGTPVGVTRAPRLPLDAQDAERAVPPISLPAGTIVATTRDLAEHHDALEALGPMICQTALGDLGLFRVTRPGPIPVYGPDDPAAMRRILASLDEESGGLALVDGGWERRGFAAPDVAQGVILVVGSGYSGHPDRSAAAMRYVVEILGLARADGPALRAFHDGAGRGATTILDPQGRTLSAVVQAEDSLVSHLESLGAQAATVVLPDALSDALLGRLVRSSARATIVVRDPTAVHVAPVYYKAWIKDGGAVRVVEPMHVIAVATNPVNRSGPDADAEDFRTAVARALPEIPVHDVVLEAARAKRRPFWRFLGLG